VDLDRQSIEKRDFPIGRRGYEPEAVDEHLAQIADEVDALRRQSRQRSGESLASAASSQVQAIVEAAEKTAAEIEREARTEAQRIRQESERSAARTRDDAVQRAQSHVEALASATQVMLQRVDAMEGELGTLVEHLRTGAGRLTADLTQLQGSMGDLYEAAGRRAAQGSSSRTAPAAGEPLEPQEPAAYEAPELAAAAPPPTPAAPPAAARAPAGGSDVDGARLVALNMALNGQSREETDRYLAENYDLPDRLGLLDEVYAAVEG
jgi:DivIVA domain-containing protein